MVIECTDLEAFQKLVMNSKYLLAQFSASYCGPCKFIYPQVLKFSKERPDVTVLKINSEEAGEIFDHFNITSIPTFLFFIQGELKDKFYGASKTELIRLCHQHFSDLPSSSPEKQKKTSIFKNIQSNQQNSKSLNKLDYPEADLKNVKEFPIQENLSLNEFKDYLNQYQ